MDRLIALLRLRATLDLRRLSRSRGMLAGVLLLLPGLLLFAGFGSFAAFVAARRLAADDTALSGISALVTLAAGLWVLSPILSGLALTETHDVSRLLHFPVAARTLVTASLLSNLLQPTAVVASCIAVAAAIGLARTVWVLPLTLAGTLASVLFAVAAAQAMGLMFQALARRRRWHDGILFVGVALGFTLSLLPAILVSGGARVLSGVARSCLAHEVFALSPFAWGARAAVFGGRGDVAAFGVWIAGQLAALVAVVAFQARLTEKIHRGDVVTREGGNDRARAVMTLPGSLGALLEKDVRAGWRDPAMRAAFFMGLVGPLVLLVLLSQTSMARSGASIFVLAAVVGLSPLGSNALAPERRGLALLMSFPIARWKVLVAKNLGALLLRLPGVLTLVVASIWMSSMLLLPFAATITLATLLLAAGTDNYLSILFPIPVAPPGGDPYAGSAGSRGLGAAVLSSLALTGVVVASAPFVLLALLPLLLRVPEWGIVSLPLAVLGAAGVYVMLLIGAERLWLGREPELLERVLEQP